MKRRKFLFQTGSGLALGSSLLQAAMKQEKWGAAAEILSTATASKQVHAASIYVRQGNSEFARTFGAAKSVDDIFLLASISKTIAAAAVMKLHETGKFALDDPASRFLPEFTGDGRETITVSQLLTHVSGLPDQLPENAALRASHAPLPKFVEAAMRTPLLFPPGTEYRYSSMAILLATEIAQRISGTPFPDFVAESIYRPLEMHRSAMGPGQFSLDELMPCQVEYAAPESGAGDPTTKNWDWNSPYWRQLAAPWGGAHSSASDVARFLSEFLHPTGRALAPETARLMITNHNPAGFHTRGLGFDIGTGAGGKGCSEVTFGHTGSTGTLCWADPKSDTICVILTTLPGKAVDPHPRNLASDRVAEWMG
jgi:CubicO group peptidase (beta-lactamase class C family)